MIADLGACASAGGGFSRACLLEREEVNILRGLLKALMPAKHGDHEPRE